MLARLHAKGFKSLNDLEIHFPRLTVLFGPNAAGKSNILEAAQMLSRIGTSRTLADAFAGPIRGYPLESFAFPQGGLPALLSKRRARLSLEADLSVGDERLRYRSDVEVQPGSGTLSIGHEYLARLTKRGKSRGSPVIEVVGDQVHIRRKGKAAHPRQEPLGQKHALVSDTRLGDEPYLSVELARNEFQGWRVYYLDPRVSMRSARPPAEVEDIGVLGEDIAPYLYRLKGENRRRFEAVRRTLRSLVPSVQHLDVDLDEKRGTLDIQVRQDGCDFSSRIISEGTLRVLALCAIAVNPWAEGLVAFEEPENGVHPRRLELIAQLLMSLAIDQGRQVIVTTHSARFCGAVLRLTRDRRADLAMLSVRRGPEGTETEPFGFANGLFQDPQLAAALSAPSEDGIFEGLLLRGLLDE